MRVRERELYINIATTYMYIIGSSSHTRLIIPVPIEWSFQPSSPSSSSSPTLLPAGSNWSPTPCTVSVPGTSRERMILCE